MRTASLPWSEARGFSLPWPLLAALLATVLDLGFAVLFWTAEGVAPLRIPQSVAAWVLGRQAFAGGWNSAVFGVLLYGGLMWGLARLYLAAARRWPALVSRPVRHGMLFGALMYAVIFHVAVPLLAVHAGAATRLDWEAACLLAYMLLIGVPCALAARCALVR